MQNTALYINGKEVEITDDFKVLFNYTVEDVVNPTAVKNTYSKTVKVQGTKINNRIFSELWNIQSHDIRFSLIAKNPFVLFLNGKPAESGYCKLNRINTEDGKITDYEITLYGGLGDFFYNLDVKEDGTKMRLCDLDFTGKGEREFDVMVDRNQVNYAWNALNGAVIPLDSIWRHINFAPCQNGKPENLDSGKVMMDIKNNPFGIQGLPEGPSDANGVFLNTMNGENGYTEWQSGDLRSYNQRPVIRVKSILHAIANPKNNGGYTVKFDRSWFNTGNPYYEKSWMTLPLISDVEAEKTDTAEDIVLDPIVLKEGDNIIPLNTIKPTVVYNRGKVGVTYRYSLNNDGNYSYALNTYTHMQNFEKKEYISAFVMQLVARDMDGEPVYGSDIQVFSNNLKGYTLKDFGYKPVVPADTVHFKEKFKSTELQSGPLRSPEHRIEINNMLLGSNYSFELHIQKVVLHNLDTQPAFDTLYRNRRQVENITDYMTELQLHTPNTVEALGEFVQSSPQRNLFTKKRMMSTRYSVLEWLLSFTKMFGLYFIKKADTKTISIVTRNTFYSTDITDNIEEKIDRSKPFTVHPIIFDRKWYEFAQKTENSEFCQRYLKSTGQEFGIKRVDTNYEFDRSVKNLLDKNVFRNAVMVRDNSRYNYIYRTEFLKNPVSLGSMYFDGCVMDRYIQEGEEYKMEENHIGNLSSSQNTTFPEYQDKGYSRVPLMWFADKDGKSVDGADVLCFYNGPVKLESTGWYNNRWTTVQARMRLSDDTPEMETLNGGPCWLYSDTDSIELKTIPSFGRYYTKGGKNIIASFNMGNPIETYTYDYSFNGHTSIYDRMWRNFIKDQYDRSTRMVDCSVLLGAGVLPDCLRNLYYFDGGLWILLEVKDYVISGEIPAKCRFLKVLDPDNYRNGQFYDLTPAIQTIEEF